MPKRQPESVKTLRRKRETRTPAPAMRIYCNGAQTEKNYFQALVKELRLNALVQVIPQDDNRLSLVKKVKKCLAASDYKGSSQKTEKIVR